MLEEVAARWHDSLAKMQEALAQGQALLTRWQESFAQGQEALSSGQAKWRASLAEGNNLFAKWQESFSGWNELYSKWLASLTTREESLAQGQELFSRWQELYATWHASLIDDQASFNKWQDSSTKMMQGISALITEAQARQQQAQRTSPVVVVLLVVALFALGGMAGYTAVWGFRTFSTIGDQPASASAPPVVPSAQRPRSSAPAAVAQPPDSTPASPPGPRQGIQTAGGTVYRIQVGAFQHRDNAEALVQELSGKGFNASITRSAGLYKVQVGAFRDRTSADRLVQKLRSLRYDDVFVIHEGTLPGP